MLRVTRLFTNAGAGTSYRFAPLGGIGGSMMSLSSPGQERRDRPAFTEITLVKFPAKAATND